MVIVPINKLHETLGLIHAFKNQITVFGLATLNDRHILTRHDEIWATRQCCKEPIKSFRIQNFSILFPVKKLIEFL